MKKLIILLLITFITLSVCVSANASNVFDMQGVMGDYEYELENISQQLEEKYKIAPKVIVDDTSIIYSQKAIDICTRFEYNDYVILAITMQDDGSYRSHWLTYPDEYVSVFDSKFKRKVEKAIKPFVSDGDYVAAAECFFEVFDKHMEKVTGHPLQTWLKKQWYEFYPLFIGFALSFTVALVAAISSVAVHKRKLKTVRHKTDAFSYIDKEYLQITLVKGDNDDLFSQLFL